MVEDDDALGAGVALNEIDDLRIELALDRVIVIVIGELRRERFQLEALAID